MRGVFGMVQVAEKDIKFPRQFYYNTPSQSPIWLPKAAAAGVERKVSPQQESFEQEELDGKRTKNVDLWLNESFLLCVDFDQFRPFP